MKAWPGIRAMNAVALTLAILAGTSAFGSRAAMDRIRDQAGAPGQDLAQYKPAADDVAYPAGFPSIGKWLISARLSYADWFGLRFEGKTLREPINVIVIDPLAASDEEALTRLLQACAKAGFISRSGHSGGYLGWLGDRLYPQLPSERHHALSDEPFEFRNDHGRFFGPCKQGGRYYFTGALSREKLDPVIRAGHEFVSFNQARDRFAKAMVEKAGFRIVAFLNLGNCLLDDPACGTADHDGIAVVLTATS